MANQTAEQIAENIFQSVDTILAQRLSHLPYDQTIICEITDISDASSGRYLAKTIGDNDVSFTVYSDKTDYEVGQKVYVRVPFGDLTQQKVITGSYVAEQGHQVEEVSSDIFWKIPGDPRSFNELQKFGSIIIYDDSSIFPGYQVCRLQFKPSISESLINTSYTISQLDLTFDIVLTYTIPSILSTTSRQKTLTVSLRSLNANLLRNPTKILVYDINFDIIESEATNLQISNITINNLKYIGTVGQDSVASAALTEITATFGFYIENNTGEFLKLYANNNFYNPRQDQQKYIYAQYYKSTDRANKQLERVSGIENDLSVFSGEENWNIVPEDENIQYKITLPVSSTEESYKLCGNRETFVIILQKGSGIIDVADSITLINVDFYAALQRQITDGQIKTQFLTARIYSSAEEDQYNFNNGIYYIYGQDGQTTDASASHIKRRAYIKFVDYFNTSHLDVSNLSCKILGGDNSSSMINLIGEPSQDSEAQDEQNNYAYVEFTVKRYYSQTSRNNSLYWTYKTTTPEGEEIQFEYEQELLFGYSGSQGADYSLILSLQDESGKEVPAISAKTAKTYTIKPTLYDYNNNQTEVPAITYEKVGTWGEGSGIDLTNDKITVSSNFDPSSEDAFGNNYYSATVKATIESLAIEGFITIPVRFDDKYILSGPSTITYDITGKKPFTSKLPYNLFNETNNLTISSINASIKRQLDADEEKDKILAALYPSISDKRFLNLPSVYSDKINEKPPTIIITKDDSLAWVQPLYIWQNKYPNSMRNGETGEVIIPEVGGDKTVRSTNVGRILSDGSGLFIGDYGDDSSTDYGLFAFKKANSDKVNNIFKLTAKGTFNGDLVLTNKGTPVNIGKKNIPVYYKDGKPVSTMKNIFNGTGDNPPQATLEDMAQAIKDLRDALSELIAVIPDVPESINEKLEKIKIKVQKENDG